MKVYILKISFTLLLLCFWKYKSNCQTNGCIDSISLNQFFPSKFTADVSSLLYTPQKDVNDNVYLSGNTDLGGPLKYWSIIKFNANNQLVWYKNYQTDFLSAFKTGGSIHDMEPNGNLLFSTSTNNPYKQIISKVDNGGNLLWSKIIKHATNINGGMSKPVMDTIGELFSTGAFIDDINKPVIMALDAVGNLNWVKRYQYVSVPKFHLIRTAVTSQNNSTVALAVQYFYNADVVTDPAVKFGLQMVKINKIDGSIIQQKSIMYYNDAGGNTPNRAYLLKLNYSNSTNQFLLYFEDINRKYVFTILDEQFNIVNTICYISNLSNLYSPLKVSIDKDNLVFMINTYQFSPQKIAYAALDKGLNIIRQKEINLSNVSFPNRNFQADLAYKKNGILNFQLATYTNLFNIPDYLFMFDNSPFYNNISPCLGVDSAIYNSVPIYVYPVTNPTIEEDVTVPLQITNQFPDFPPVDFALPKTEVCKTVSICDTIKLFGSKYHCLSNPIDSFKIYRNPLCVRKTNWQADTNYIKILSKNDTALHVQYLQPYRGSIKVSFGGCTLTDSIAIEVY
ncbi:MAG: hypothetical protein LH615_08915, partial [Ferruginibacter sp.]|nr:hypothetical protein [Ferruginibacter sp.]